MWKLGKIAAVAGGLVAAASAMAGEVEVLHYWTSGGEAAAVGALRGEFEKRGGTWIDEPVAGGGGDTHDQVLRSRTLAGDAPGAAIPKASDAMEWGRNGFIADMRQAADEGKWDEKIPASFQPTIKLDGNWMLARQLEDEPARRVRRMIALADGAIIALRRIAADLRPAALDELGFVAALEDLTDTLTERFGIACSLHLDPGLDLREPHATEVFRIVQEALSNVAKHAKATRVEVHVQCQGDDLVVSIRDNGVGFAADQPRSRQSLGLVGLRERVELLRGSLSIDRRYSTGSRPAAAASSSTNDSAANTLRNAPSDRSDDVRSGISSSRWFTTRYGKS